MKPRAEVRFAGRDKLVNLIEAGEVVQRLRRSSAERLDRPVQAADDFTYGNQIAAFTLHGLFSHVSQTTPAAKLTEGVSIDDYSTWRAVRFADPDEIG